MSSELCLSSRFLNELTVIAEITSSGSLFQEFTTRILKKFDLCKLPLFSLGLYSFLELPLVILLKSLSALLKNLSHFTFSFPLMTYDLCAGLTAASWIMKPFGEIGSIFFLYNFHRKHSLLKLVIKSYRRKSM